MAAQLAALGGDPAVPVGIRQVDWPVIADTDRAAVLRVLDSHRLVSNAAGEREVPELERRIAERVGVRHCVGLSNGTAAISVALAALGVRPGDEVIVPALSFIASGLAPLHQLAVPVFADIDPGTFNLDPDAAAACVSPRTTAIVAVHLHGLPAEMAALRELADRHGLLLIEDAAQAFGATYRGRPVGSLGHAAAFSLQTTKNLPTCGEGGLLTTDSSGVAERARKMRQFGEVIPDGGDRDYVSHCLGWNHKLNPVQAAFAASQLDRFDDYERARQANIRRFLRRLQVLPGLVVPIEPAHSRHVWHILRLRLRPAEAGLSNVRPGALVSALRRLLRAEGVPVSRYQPCPLPDQKVFRDREGFGNGLPWHLNPGAPVPSCPTAGLVVEDSFTLQKRHLHPDTGPLLDRYADAFEKVWCHLDVAMKMARARS